MLFGRMRMSRFCDDMLTPDVNLLRLHAHSLSVPTSQSFAPASSLRVFDRQFSFCGIFPPAGIWGISSLGRVTAQRS
jgi:hypothetical protein